MVYKVVMIKVFVMMLIRIFNEVLKNSNKMMLSDNLVKMKVNICW